MQCPRPLLRLNSLRDREKSLRIGLELLTARPFGWGDLRDAAASVEDVGFDSLWVPDHIEKEMNGQIYPFFESIALLGGIAEATTGIKIGASVHNAALRHPFQLAHSAVTLDEISDGRLILGVGAGAGGYEHGFLGEPKEARFSKFSESLQVLASLLRGEQVDFQGEHWQLEGARLSDAGRHRIPLMIGARGPKTIDLAFRCGDEWNTFELADPRPESLRERVALADAAEGQNGRRIRRSLDVMVSFNGSTRNPDLPLLPAITGGSRHVAEQLLEFAELGFHEVHCYGPAPSQPGGAAWEKVVEILHQNKQAPAQ